MPPPLPPCSYFNVVQSECFDAVYGCDAPLVVAAPTGSGKTGARMRRARAHAHARRTHACPRARACAHATTASAMRPPHARPTRLMHAGVMELALVRLWAKRLDAASGRLDPPGGRCKAMYLAPIRALVQERHSDWAARFGPLGLRVVELSGAPQPGGSRAALPSCPSALLAR